MRRALLVGLALASFACAPRMAKTHYARWAEQDAARKDEEARDQKAHDWLMNAAGVAKAGSGGTASSGGGSSAHMNDKSSGGGGGSNVAQHKSTSTSTKSRVIKPSDTPDISNDDDAIY